MASRRRYKPRGYRDGGAVTPDAITAEPVSSPDVPLAPAEPVIGTEPSDAVPRALEATRHADELQRQAHQAQQPQPPMTVDRYIDSLAGLTDHKRSFLKAHPEMLGDVQRKVMGWHYNAALGDGVVDDTEEMNQRLLEGVRRDMGIHRQRQIDAARAAVNIVPKMPEPTIEQAAERLASQATAIRTMVSAQAATPMAVAAELLPAPMPTRARSLPIGAPVSREIPTPSGTRPADFSKITLSPLEREIARNSFGPNSKLSMEERERSYAVQKAKLERWRASGEYPERERN